MALGKNEVNLHVLARSSYTPSHRVATTGLELKQYVESGNPLFRNLNENL